MKTRVQITCKDGDMFAMTLDKALYAVLVELDTVLDPCDGEGIDFEAFGRKRTVWADDVAGINIKEAEK